jgi:hypothetical protein
MMKRWIIPLMIVTLLAAAGFFVARHLSERHRQEGNVRHDAHWFTDSIKIGNDRAVANYLARPKMDWPRLEQALRTHAQSLLTTDFDTAPVRFGTQGSTLFATFHCTGGAALTFYTEDGGDVWRVAELKAH